MSPELFLHTAIEPALALLLKPMDTQAARSMLLAIAAQESGLKHRRQIGGPARSYFQFEQGGILGVLTHPASRAHAESVMAALDYPVEDTIQPNEYTCYDAIEHNDILAAAFARLLLWTLPQQMPVQNAPSSGWAAYQAAWRPGRPRREAWDQNFADAWETTTLLA